MKLGLVDGSSTLWHKDAGYGLTLEYLDRRDAGVLVKFVDLSHSNTPAGNLLDITVGYNPVEKIEVLRVGRRMFPNREIAEAFGFPLERGRSTLMKSNSYLCEPGIIHYDPEQVYTLDMHYANGAYNMMLYGELLFILDKTGLVPNRGFRIEGVEVKILDCIDGLENSRRYATTEEQR